MKPLATWNDDNSADDLLVWWTRLDGRWQIEVQRTGDRTGNLIIFDRENENSVLHSEEVSLSWGAQFGPDEGDVSNWQDRSIEIVDAL